MQLCSQYSSAVVICNQPGGGRWALCPIALVPTQPCLFKRIATMSPIPRTISRRSILVVSAVVAVGVLIVAAGFGWAVSSTPMRPVAGPQAEQPPAKLVVDPPKPEPLARGVAILQFRTENLQIVPVFGFAAATVSPRIGHLHITVDDSSWHWAHTSDGPIICRRLTSRPAQNSDRTGGCQPQSSREGSRQV